MQLDSFDSGTNFRDIVSQLQIRNESFILAIIQGWDKRKLTNSVLVSSSLVVEHCSYIELTNSSGLVSFLINISLMVPHVLTELANFASDELLHLPKLLNRFEITGFSLDLATASMISWLKE